MKHASDISISEWPCKCHCSSSWLLVSAAHVLIALCIVCRSKPVVPKRGPGRFRKSPASPPPSKADLKVKAAALKVKAAAKQVS